MPQVSIIMGSDSDWPLVSKSAETLSKFGVTFDVHVSSAHRTPDATATLAKGLYASGVKAVIAAAGKAAHLPGVIAAYTCLPVIGLPVAASRLDGMDALLSIVQMPAGIPVAAVAIDGAENAALLAVSVLAASDAALYEKLLAYREQMAEGVRAKDQKLKATLGEHVNG